MDERRALVRPFGGELRCAFGVGVSGSCVLAPGHEGSHDDGSARSTTGHTIDPNGVNHPKHYNLHPAGIECIDVIEHMTANIAFTIKHVWRAGLKEGEATLKDIDKALWYLKRERDRLEKMGVK